MPTFEPARWNDNDGIQRRNNCYDYCRDMITNEFTQPGRNHGIELEDEPYECREVGDAAETEGVRRIAEEGACDRGEGCWQVALVIDPDEEPEESDFHWYRQDDDGTWSHKPGKTAARNVDDSGNTIDDPQECDRGSYDVFCGFFCVCPAEGEGEESESTVTMAETGRGGVTAEMLLYSGREDPSLALEPEQVGEVTSRLVDLPASDVEPGGGLGYAGFVVSFGDTREPGQPEEVRVFDGVVAVKQSGETSFFQDANELETYLLQRFRETDAWPRAVRRIGKTAAPGERASGMAAEE